MTGHSTTATSQQSWPRASPARGFRIGECPDVVKLRWSRHSEKSGY